MSFTEELTEKNKSAWDLATSHNLTAEWCEGKLPLEKLWVYLNQDLKFFSLCFRLMARAISLNEDDSSNIVLGKQLGFISNDENTYFQDCIKQVEEKLINERRIDRAKAKAFKDVELPSVSSYLKFMECSNSGVDVTYAEVITILFVMEQIYLEWANKGLESKTAGLHWWYNEWIALHSGEAFEKWCQFLRGEVERVMTKTTQQQRAKVEAVFEKTVELEAKFFDDCYSFDYKELM
jgi:thiaminase/transcriptional activator TenA